MNASFDIESDPGDFTPISKVKPSEMLDAQIKTADLIDGWDEVDDEKIISQAEQTAARDTFQAMTAPAPVALQKEKLTNLQTPAAVRHLTTMLTAYDWHFVEMAQQLRGYTVAQILEETKNSNPHVRLKALAMLGKVTEVGLFTEKVEVKQADVPLDELEERLRAKLGKYMMRTGMVEDAKAVDTDARPD